MILADLGYGVLNLILATAIWSAVASAVGARRKRPEMLTSARNGLLVTAGLSTLAAALLFILLLNRDFQVRYVYDHVSTYLKPAYVLSAFWAGLQGSQLLWLWMAAVATALLIVRRPTWDRELRPVAMAFLAGVQAFFALLLIWMTNPFELLPVAPEEGASLNPLLQNFWMIVHPPIVFAAYALWTVPAAYALAALVTGCLDSTWLFGMRRWTMAAWVALGLGILVGAWWAYLELGWGGYWGWDPVENSSLIPWLVGTAFVHSALIQERRDLFRAWNVLLAILTFLLTVFATFVTRSGLIQSVHAFAKSPIGYAYLAFILVTMAVTVGLMVARSRALRGQGELGDLLSREFAFLVTQLLLLGTAAAVWLGTLWPTFSEALVGTARTLGAENYNRLIGPLGLLLIVLLGLCPWIEWRTMSAERLWKKLWVQAAIAVLIAGLGIVLGVDEGWVVVAVAVVAFAAMTLVRQMAQGIVARLRTTSGPPLRTIVKVIRGNCRRYGGQIIHFGILLIVAGVVASQAYQTEAQVNLTMGESVEVQGYLLRYQDYTYEQIEEGGNKVRNQAVVEVYRGDRKLATLAPERNWYSNVQGAVSEVALRSTLREDLYLVLAGLEPDGYAAFQVLITPMVLWLWIGGAVLLLGTVIAMTPPVGAARMQEG
ncbi:MAG: heme lyase CcmF/NrfE family subunit [Anaerolineae bacterium]